MRPLSIVIEGLPTSAINALIKTDYNASAFLLNNVRIGRVHNLGYLAALVKVGLPQVPDSGRAATSTPAHPVALVGESRVAYHRPKAPKGPRNLAPALAAWLRQQGYTATEYRQATYAHRGGALGRPQRRPLRAELLLGRGAGAASDATCSLRVFFASTLPPEVLFTAQRVRPLLEVRRLLPDNVRHHNARLLACPAAPASS